MRLLPRRWVFAATQAAMVGLLLVFWTLFKTEQSWVSVAFYLWGVLAGSLLISQFWSLANDIYDARQAKRVFGFIGGGASLGGIIGAGIAGQFARAIGTNNLLLVAAVMLGHLRQRSCRSSPCGKSRAGPEATVVQGKRDEPARSGGAPDQVEAFSDHRPRHQLRRHRRRHRRAAGQHGGRGAGDSWQGRPDRVSRQRHLLFVDCRVRDPDDVDSRVHRLLGIGFALLLLPFTLGGTGMLMLAIPALWTAATARVLDTSLRYTVDKTTREILFMPLPTAMKYRAKPFADVAVDRFAKGGERRC